MRQKLQELAAPRSRPCRRSASSTTSSTSRGSPGVDHVCLGSDFDGVPRTPAGLDDVSKLPFITRELTKRGFAPGDVRKVLGENVLRVLEANERGRGSSAERPRLPAHP